MLKKSLIIVVLAICLVLGLEMHDALAETVTKAPPKPDGGDTAWMLVSAALVLLMTPGLAFFYGGFVRSRNILNTLMMSFILMAIVGVTWILWGYSLAFAEGNPFIGGLQWLGLNGVNARDVVGYLAKMAYETDPKVPVLDSYAATIPHQTFMMYQGMFAIITPALISGAIVERISFRVYVAFVLIWSTFIYSPLAHMVWGKGGFLGLYGGLGALDFAGGTVVHISSGVSALVAAILLKPRRAHPHNLSSPHNVPFILLGAGLLWFGWFGFNGGSALAVQDSSGMSVATVAFVATNTAAAAAAVAWLILEWALRGHPTAVGMATGAVAGLVGITPAAGFVDPIGSILIGAITATVCFFAVSFKSKLGIDDALDTFPVHGVGGTVGAILTGVFATKAVNSAGADGLLHGNPGQVWIQIEAVIVAYLVAGIGTFVILKILQALFGTLRVKPEEEFNGVDIYEHGEEGYGGEFAGGKSI
jgi:ammonium transporter, Amt family